MRPFKNADQEFSSEVKTSAGWYLNDVKFHGQRMYVIPCGANAKKEDPYGKIIHNYSYPSKQSGSFSVAPNNQNRNVLFNKVLLYTS